MDLKTMKRIAEQETERYRDNRAYMQGVLDAGGSVERLRFQKRAAWAIAVEYAKAYWDRTDPAKAAFFSIFYRLDHPHKSLSSRPSIHRIAMQLHVTESTLYRWKNEILTTVILAAIQTGALRPYALPASTGAETASQKEAPYGNE